jgi:EmrB/QacA subfamily drug resistance transporter
VQRTERLALTIAVLASFVSFLDGTIVNVALPALALDLDAGLSLQQWVVDAYLITLGALILLAGSLSDLLGRVPVLRLGLIGFGVASLACAVAPTPELLVVARAVQGIGAALLVPSSLALIVSTFPPQGRPRAIALWTAWTSAATIAGPVIGGAIVDLGSWRLVFAINVVPIAIVLRLLTRLPAPPERPTGTRLDVAGAVLGVLGVGLPVFALIEQQNLGWGSPLILAPLVVGVLCLAGFLVREATAAQPMMPLGLFRARNSAWGNIATTFIYAGLSLSGFVLVLFLQETAGFSATLAGLASLPVTLLLIALSSVVGRLDARFGPRVFMTAGPLLAAVGWATMLGVGDPVDYWTQLLPGILLFGVGLGITVAPLTNAVLGAIESERAGIASAVNNAVARVAGLVAIAFGGLITGGSVGVEGFTRAVVATVVLLALGGIASFVGIRSPAPEDVPEQR